MAPCTHPGMKRLFCLNAKSALGRFAPSSLPHYEQAFLHKGKKHPLSLRLLGLASLYKLPLSQSGRVNSYPRKFHCQHIYQHIRMQPLRLLLIAGFCKEGWMLCARGIWAILFLKLLRYTIQQYAGNTIYQR